MNSPNMPPENQQHDDKDIARLIQSLAEEDNEIRERAIILLSKMSEVSIPPLINALRDMDRWYSAVEALVKIGEPAIEALINVLDDAPINTFAHDALRQIGKSAVLPLINALQDANSERRFWAAETLGHIGDQRAIEPLRITLTDPDSQVRKTAAEALQKISFQ